MAPKPAAGRVAASIYMDAAEWRAVRLHALEQDTSASVLVTVLLRRHLAASPAEQAEVLAEAREVNQDRRSR
jgi:hypothetical protein